MKINRITYGFVVQQFDTEQNKWVNQHFIGDYTEHEYNDHDEPGVNDHIDPINALEECNPPVLNMDMIQPT